MISVKEKVTIQNDLMFIHACFPSLLKRHLTVTLRIATDFLAFCYSFILFFFFIPHKLGEKGLPKKGGSKIKAPLFLPREETLCSEVQVFLSEQGWIAVNLGSGPLPPFSMH